MFSINSEGTGVLVIKMDDATVALLRKSLKGVFDKHFPVFFTLFASYDSVATVLEIREKSGKVKMSKIVREKSGNSRKKPFSFRNP